MAHPVDEHVGKKLRDRRTRMGISQESLAKTSGITFQQVQKYERATNRISVSRIFEFANVLQVPVSYFFEGLSGDNDYEFAEDSTPFIHEGHNAIPAHELKELINAYSKIKDAEMRKSVKTLIKGIASGATVL